MTVLAVRVKCPHCGARIHKSKFDATFRLRDGGERLCLNLPSGLCAPCNKLYIDPELIELLDLGPTRCVFAIESASVAYEERMSAL
jgi:phage FluMu protein Com